MTDRRMEERRKFILAFKESLLCLEDEGDRADIMRALKEFQTTMLVEDLVDSLKRALINPQSLAVYVTLYPLIPGRLRAEYRTLIPKVPTFTVKIIRIRRNGTEPLGFTVRGGREHQLGIFITNVLPDSRAHKCGLKPGYQILKINAFPLKESTHEESVSLLTLKRAYILTCKDIGMIPEIRRNMVNWTYAPDMEPAPISRQPMRVTSPFQTGIRTVNCKLDGSNFGCSIKGGTQHNTGIFIHKITPNSKAEELGLQVGDEIIEVNGKSFSNLTHVEAVHYLRKQDSLIIKVKPGNAVFQNRPESYQSGASFGGEDTLKDWRESTGGQFILKKKDNSQAIEGPRDYEDFFGEGLFAAPIFAQSIEGYGPTMALPGLTSIEVKSEAEGKEDFRDGDDQGGYPGLIADVMRDNEIRRSISNFEEVIASVSPFTQFYFYDFLSLSLYIA